MRNIGQYLSIDGEEPCISYFKSSYLFLATESGVDILKSNAEIQQYDIVLCLLILSVRECLYRPSGR